MPKVQIQETYKYGSATTDLTNFTVYVPVKGVEHIIDTVKNTKEVASEPTLYTSLNQLLKANYYNGSSVSYKKCNLYDDQDVNFIMARRLLEKGLPVLLEGLDTLYTFTSYDGNGEDANELATGAVLSLGLAIFDSTEYNKVQVVKNSVEGFVGNIYYVAKNAQVGSTKYELFIEVPESDPATLATTGMYVTLDGTTINTPDFNRLADKALYNIRFLTVGQYNDDKDMNLALIDCVSLRKDAIALLDDKIDMSDITPNTMYKNVSAQVGRVRTYFEGLVGEFTTEEGTPVYNQVVSNDKLKNAGAFTPWFKAELTTVDRANVEGDEEPELISAEFDAPASFGYLSAFIKAVKQNPEWFAMAGSFRGTIDEFKTVRYNYTSAEVEILQGRSKTKVVDLDDINDNIGLAINPISKIIPFGYLINGNRTMYIGDYDEENRPNYRALLSIRNLVCALSKQSYFASKKYTFEPNTDITYINFKSEIIPLLDKMRSGLGIRGYRFDRLATTEKGRIKALISIKPIEPVEDFDITIELDDSVDIIE